MLGVLGRVRTLSHTELIPPSGRMTEVSAIISRGSLECPGLSGVKCCIPDGTEPKFGFNPEALFTKYVAAAPYDNAYDNGEATTEFGSELLSAADSSWSMEQPQMGLNVANTAPGNIDQPFTQPEPLAVVASNLNGGAIDTVDMVFSDSNGAGLGFKLPDVELNMQ